MDQILREQAPLDYDRQHIYSTGRSAELTASWLEQNGVRRPFLVCGKSALKLPGWDTCLAVWPRERIFSDFSPNPVYEDAQEAARRFASACCGALVALGGGSAIDVAKAIKHLSAAMPGNEGRRRQARIPFLAIPTTAGTGSESTHFAVIYRDGKKQSLSDSSLRPSSVFLDSGLLKALPPYQKRCTAMDALCQCIESIWARDATEESRTWAAQGIRLLLENMDMYLAGDAEAAGRVLLAANYSGRAIDLSKTTAAHALSYGLTSCLGLPHGHAVALTLPPVWRRLAERADTEETEAALRLIDGAFGAEGHASAAARFLAFRNRLGLRPSPIGPEVLPRLEGLVNAERLKNTPVRLSPGDITDIYKEIVAENESEGPV